MDIKILASKSVLPGPIIATDDEECLYVRFHYFMVEQMESSKHGIGRFQRLLKVFGILPHESALMLHINDAHYDFEFLAGILRDLPEMHNPKPTLNRYRESMEWISRTIDALRGHTKTSNLRDEQLLRLEIMCHLICSEMAARDGFDLDFDQEAAEFSKTSTPAILTVPICLKK